MARGYIRHRSKGSWQVQVFLGKNLETGKWSYHTETVRGSRDDAERKLTELLRQVDLGSFVRPLGLTVREYFEQWYLDHVRVHVGNRTCEGYRGNLDRYILPKLGEVLLDKLTSRHVQAMESSLLREGGKKGQGLSSTTVLQVHRIVSCALKDAVRLGLLSRNVAELVKSPRVKRYEARALTWAEVRLLLDSIADSGRRMVVFLALQTGLRRSEFLGLQWRDIDLPTGVLTVRRALVKLPSGGMELSVPKSGRPRAVALSPAAVEALEMHRDRQIGFSGDADFVFCRPDGSPFDPDLLTQWFKRTAVKAGFGNLRLHDLRHTHASLMLTAGVPMKVASERMGHSSIGITADLYSHVQPAAQLQAVEVFGDAWRLGVDGLTASPTSSEDFEG